MTTTYKNARAGSETGLEGFFRPNSVAVIGASRDKNKWGRRVIDYTKRAGFRGSLYGVNHSVTAVTHEDGITLVPSLAAVDAPIDLAVIALPARLTPAAVEDCATSGVRAAVLAASGFSEISADGRDAERRMLDASARTGMRLLGPNGFGLFVAGAGLNLTPREDLPAGSVALATQSGNVAIALFAQAQRAGIGFSSCVGVGNQIDVSFGELLAHFAVDENCEAVALYVEGIPSAAGSALRDGLAACRRAGKPVVVLKAGHSVRGARTAATHTASLASDDRVWDALLSSEAAIRVRSTEQMIDVLSAARLPRIGRVLVLTDGGGDSVMAVDALADAGLPLADLSLDTMAAIDQLAPPGAPRSAERNPVTLDTAGGLEDDPLLLARCVEAAATDPAVDTVLISGVFGGYYHLRDRELACVQELLTLRNAGVSLVLQSAFADSGEEPLIRLREAGVPVFPTVQRLVRALSLLTHAAGYPSTSPDNAASDTVTPQLLSVEDTHQLLQRYGIQLPAFAILDQPSAVQATADEWKYPVCLKLADTNVAHKSDVGGVILDIETPEELLSSAQRLWAQFPGAPLLLMPMLSKGAELLLGTRTDQIFGPVSVVGRGGIWAEVDPDVALAVGVLTTEAARDAILSLRCAPTLTGHRGQPPADINSVARVLSALSRLAIDRPDLSVDLNPVITYPEGFAIADARIAHRQDAGGRVA